MSLPSVTTSARPRRLDKLVELVFVRAFMPFDRFIAHVSGLIADVRWVGIAWADREGHIEPVRPWRMSWWWGRRWRECVDDGAMAYEPYWLYFTHRQMAQRALRKRHGRT